MEKYNNTAAEIATKHAFPGCGYHHSYADSWVVNAMEEYATLHSSQLKEELKNLEDELRVEVNLKKTFSNAVDKLQEELSALREENERLRKALPSDEELVTELIARYSRMGRGLEIARDAFTQAVLWIRGRALHPSHNTEEK